MVYKKSLNLRNKLTFSYPIILFVILLVLIIGLFVFFLFLQRNLTGNVVNERGSSKYTNFLSFPWFRGFVVYQYLTGNDVSSPICGNGAI